LAKSGSRAARPPPAASYARAYPPKQRGTLVVLAGEAEPSQLHVFDADVRMRQQVGLVLGSCQLAERDGPSADQLPDSPGRAVSHSPIIRLGVC